MGIQPTPHQNLTATPWSLVLAMRDDTRADALELVRAEADIAGEVQQIFAALRT